MFEPSRIFSKNHKNTFHDLKMNECDHFSYNIFKFNLDMNINQKYDRAAIAVAEALLRAAFTSREVYHLGDDQTWKVHP